jgi:restriction endonuclease S subunit
MGKLVPQDPNDPPVTEFLSKIEHTMTAFLSKKKVTYREVTENPDIVAMKYNIPISWEWVRFKDVVFFQEGPGIRNWQFTSQGVKLLNVSNILFNDQLDLTNSDKYVSREEFIQKYRHFQIEKGDLLFAGSGASWGKVAWYKDPGYKVMLNTSTMRLCFFHSDFSANYLFYFLKSEFFKKQLSFQLAGLQPNFGSTHFSRIYMPIPPLAEQHRIVAKIDQLMTLCDAMENQITSATDKQTTLLNSLMAMV